MSGPKVVNIEAVRRQRQRESAAHLRELNALVEECLRLQSAPAAAADIRKHAEALLTRLDQLRARERWDELVTETASHRDFYQHEAATLRQRAVERHAEALRREHRQRQITVQLTAELNRLPDSPERVHAQQSLSETEMDDAAWASAVKTATALVAGQQRKVTTAESAQRLRELTAAYAEPETHAGSPALPVAPREVDELRLDRCWSLLGELALLDDAGTVAGWQQQARDLATAPPDERALLLDSLVLQLTTHLRARREQQAAVAAVQSTLAELEALTVPEVETWRTRLHAALEPPVAPEAVRTLTSAARLWIAGEHTRADASAQRIAVLRALAALGYEVREGMATAWTEQGRVVVHKPADSVYGIEFSAPAAGTAFQTRVVATGDAEKRSRQRDREVETTWCSEFGRLQTLLTAEGFQTRLAQAHAPGTVPIKSVSVPDARTRTEHLPAMRSRSP